MSVLAVSDVVFKDLLTELNLKPWPEKLRGYCFAVSVVSALFMVYITLSSTVINCLPLHEETVTTCTTISTTEAQFFNNFCSNQLPGEVSFYGLSPLGGCIIIMICANWWTMRPRVVNSFRTFVRFEKIIEELNLPSDKLCELSTKLITSKIEDESMKVRKACTLLWKYKSSTSLKRVYVIRNIILISIIVSCIAALSGLLYVLHTSEINDFKCQLNDRVQNTLYGKANVTKRYLCSYNVINHIPFVWTLMCSLIAHCIVVVSWLSYLCGKTREKSNCLSEKGCQTYRDINFMVQFWKNSRPENSGAIKQLVGHIFSAALTEFKKNLENAAIVDIDMLEHYLSLKKDGWKDAFPALQNAILNDFETNTIDDPMNTSTESSASDSNLNPDNASQHSRIAQCIRYSAPRCPLKKFLDFFDILCKQKCWEIIANILVSEESDWIYDDPDPGKNDDSDPGRNDDSGPGRNDDSGPGRNDDSGPGRNDDSGPGRITIDTNEIGKPFKSQCSILYYLLVGKLLDTDGTKYIIKNLKMCTESFYVHFHGQTRDTSKILLSKASNGKTKSVAEKLMDEQNLIFEKNTRNSSYIGELKKGNYDFAQELSRYKFTEWDADRRELAQLANSEKQWEILVALLNARIVEDDESTPLDTGCPVQEFVESIKNPGLRYGILGAALSSNPLLGARITALRHIVKFTQGKFTNPAEVKANYENIFRDTDYCPTVKIKVKKLLGELFSEPSQAGASGPTQSSVQPQVETSKSTQRNAPPPDDENESQQTSDIVPHSSSREVVDKRTEPLSQQTDRTDVHQASSARSSYHKEDESPRQTDSREATETTNLLLKAANEAKSDSESESKSKFKSKSKSKSSSSSS